MYLSKRWGSREENPCLLCIIAQAARWRSKRPFTWCVNEQVTAARSEPDKNVRRKWEDLYYIHTVCKQLFNRFRPFTDLRRDYCGSATSPRTPASGSISARLNGVFVT